MRLRILLLLLFVLCAPQLYAQTDTVSVFFPFNESTLTQAATYRLDSAIYNGKIPARQAIKIIGYTDAVGRDTFNLRLSRQRAASVKAYLLQSGFEERHITLIVGKGESMARVAERPGGNMADRRVDIVPTGKVPPSPGGNSFVKFKSIPGTTSATESAATVPRKASATDIGNVRVGETLILDNIYFYAGRHIVRKESNEALDALVQSLKAHPNVRIRIEGHVCCVPAAAKDAIDDDTGREELSVNRAIAIRRYLVAHGIDEGRLSFAGFGHRNPIIPVERNEDDANQNRRVEIRVVE